MEWWNGGMVEWWNGGMVAWWLGGLVAWWNGKTSLGYNKKKKFTIVWTSLVTTASLKKSHKAFVKGDEQEEESYACITSKNVEFNRKIYIELMILMHIVTCIMCGRPFR